MMSTGWNITGAVVANWSGHERVAPMGAGRLTRGVDATASTR